MSKRFSMSLIDAKTRRNNFTEVALGYTEEEALAEANRCLNCKNKPCVSGCPVSIDIPAFIAKIKAKDYEGAYQIIDRSSSLPAICGRVCPQETQCEKFCIQGIKGDAVAIGNLERFVADYHYQHQHDVVKVKPNNKKVAVIGSGPSGLTCAGDLAKAGFTVTIFEALHIAGGVLVYGIPEFRLPKKIVEMEIKNLTDLGVTIKTNMIIGRIKTIDDLFAEGYQAIYVGTGAGLPNFMNIKGENLNGVYAANEFLTRVNLMKAYQENSQTPISRGKKVAVVGGGNVAVDAARCALRLGAEEVSIIYRRSRTELPARIEEVIHAEDEGVKFHFLTNPIEIIGNDDFAVTQLRCVQMELAEPDESGRRKPVVKVGSEFLLEVDTVIIAIGTSPNPLIKMTTDQLTTSSWGGIIINEDGLTTKPMVYAGGDAVTGSATVIKAMQAGKLAAKAIFDKLDK